MEAAKIVPNQYFDYDTVRVDRERSEIRLIRLHLAGDGDPLICTMKSFDLDSCPSYDPFSYVWGSGKKTPIQCNGVRLDILPNLYLALKQYRSELKNIGPAGEIGSEEEPENGHSGAKWIWADAMCIDQNNVEEKSWQIQLMRKIYEHGQTTWVWLGKDDKHTIEAFDLLYTLLDVRYKQEMTSDKKTILRNTMGGARGFRLSTFHDQFGLQKLESAIASRLVHSGVGHTGISAFPRRCGQLRSIQIAMEPVQQGG
jgi:hypothetical protein